MQEAADDVNLACDDTEVSQVNVTLPSLHQCTLMEVYLLYNQLEGNLQDSNTNLFSDEGRSGGYLGGDVRSGTMLVQHSNALFKAVRFFSRYVDDVPVVLRNL